MEDERFTPMAGDVTYQGSSSSDVTYSGEDGRFTLNGKPIKNGEVFQMENGDIIKDTEFKGMGKSKWEFRSS